MRPVELRAIWDLPDGNQLVRTGFYVFDGTTIAEARDLLKDADGDVGRPPDRFEIDMREESR